MCGGALRTISRLASLAARGESQMYTPLASRLQNPTLPHTASADCGGQVGVADQLEFVSPDGDQSSWWSAPLTRLMNACRRCYRSGLANKTYCR